MESCKDLVRRIVRSLTEWRAAGVCWENCKVSDRVESCKEFVGEL